jgi:hypothetical protein
MMNNLERGTRALATELNRVRANINVVALIIVGVIVVAVAVAVRVDYIDLLAVVENIGSGKS